MLAHLQLVVTGPAMQVYKVAQAQIILTDQGKLTVVEFPIDLKNKIIYNKNNK
jgi:hypothetical protein